MEAFAEAVSAATGKRNADQRHPIPCGGMTGGHSLGTGNIERLTRDEHRWAQPVPTDEGSRPHCCPLQLYRLSPPGVTTPKLESQPEHFGYRLLKLDGIHWLLDIRIGLFAHETLHITTGEPYSHFVRNTGQHYHRGIFH